MSRPTSDIHRLVVMTALCLLLPFASARATLPLSDALTESTRYRGWDVSALSVTGLDKPLADSLRRGLALLPRRNLLRTRRAPLFAATLEADARRARIFLAQRGYPWARIAVDFAPARDKRRVEVTLIVTPGPPVLIDRLDVTDLPDGLSGPATRGAPLLEGGRFTEHDLERATTGLAEIVAAAGHPRATITPEVALRDSDRVQIDLHVEAGPRCRIGPARLTGASRDLLDLARRNVAFTEGRLYAPRHLSDARRNLRELDLFRRTDLSVDDPHDGVVDLLADLAPRKPRSTEIDVGWWTEDFLRVGARWRHRNLLRGGRGGEVRVAASRFRREGAASLWWPTLLGPRTRVTTRFQVVREYEDSYDLASEQTELWELKRIGDGGTLQGGVTVANVRYDAKSSDAGSFLAQDGLLTALHLRANLERVDDPIDPTRGLSGSARAEWSPPAFPSDNSYALGRAEIAVYRPLAGAVVVGRIEAGLARPLGDSQDLLPNKRFYAGGSSSMRGARRHRLGPLDSGGDPIGGEALALMSGELRMPLKGPIGIVLFADAGQVWRLAEEIAMRDVSVAVGPGLTVRTPVGPVRADGAFNLEPRPAGEPDFVLHVSVGHPF